MLDHCRTFCRPRQGRKERRCIQRRRAPSRKSPAKDDEDYAVFAQVLEAAVERTQMRLLAYCSLPNHGHLVIWPQEDGRLFPVHAPGGRSRTRNVGTLTAAVRAVATCTNFAASIAYEYSWNKNGIASVGIDIYKLNTPGRGSFRRWAGNDARLNNVRHDSCCSYPRRLSASGSGYVATDTRPSRTTVIPDARRREIQDSWLRW
jgi:hypothetical protein